VIFALWGELDVFVSGLGILEDFSFVIANHDLLVVVIKDVAGINRHFAAAAGSVDDVLWDGIAGSVTAQPLDDLDPFCDRSAMSR